MPDEQEPPPDLQASPDPDQPDAAVLLALQRRRTRRLILTRLLLLGVSSAGVLGAVALWAAGRGGLGLRVVAGDLLTVMFVLLLS